MPGNADDGAGDDELREVVLDRDLLICDAHHHLWDGGHPRYQPAYTLDQVEDNLAAGHRVVSVIYVECSSGYRDHGPESTRPVGETEWVVAQIEARAPFIKGIVARAELRDLPGLGKALDEHLAAAGSRLRGIRCTAAWDPNAAASSSPRVRGPGLLLDPGFQRGVAELGRRQLVFETWIYDHQLPDLVDLARSQPGTRMVLDHLGGPVDRGLATGQRSEELGQWQTHMERLADCPNVFVKLGGVGRLTHRSRYPDLSSSGQIADFWAPAILWCIEHFGVDRCMFESNFPADAGLGDYVTLWNAYKRVARACSPAERRALFHDTALGAYGLR